MSNKKYSLKIIAALSILLLGCGEDYLDVQPSQFLTQKQVADAADLNPDVLKGSMSGIYTLMFQTETGGTTNHDDFGQKGYDIASDFLSGDLALSKSTYGWYRTLNQFQVTQDFTFIFNYQVWRYYYRIIRSANLVIDGLGGNEAVPKVKENKYIMGQAKAMRAYAYFYLSQFYQNAYDASEEILPIYKTPNVPNQPKSAAADIYALMISDLKEAISLLADYERPGITAVDKTVAQGLLAYVYGAMGDFAQVKTLTDAVIKSGAYTLMSAQEVLGGFNSAATPGWMWGVDITTDNGLNLVSWWGQMDAYTYSYQWAGDRKAMDQSLFNAIRENDVRKKQVLNNPKSGYHLTPIGKFYHPDKRIGRQRTITTDYLYMRVAEMYLLHAEAAAKTGDEGGAKVTLKKVLAERFNNAADYAYVDALSGQALQDEIYLQTRIELFAEGKSYLALKRGKKTVVRGTNHLSNVGISIPYNDDRLTFEIPQSEIQNNPFITK